MSPREKYWPGDDVSIVLASASPRRRDLLEQVGVIADCLPVDIDETSQPGEAPQDLVLRLAKSKAETCVERLKEANELSSANFRDQWVLGADTIIDFNGRSLGKPVNREDAVATLLELSGNEHAVHTGIAVVSSAQNRVYARVVTTRVRFGEVSETDALRYWETGEPADKAGSYGIQGIGARFVASLSGSYSNVVGLPLYETLELLEKLSSSDFFRK